MKNAYLKRVLGEECLNRVQSSRVLMVGAGGLGCELLKDLVLCGYGEIHIVDLDTITLSNLNRQFLFRKTDIDKSKSLTVAKAVEAFNYLGARLVPLHGNIMDTKQFPLEWWQQFDYIYNALDNIEARSYVNSMCLLLKTPFMESGTEGYNGHVSPILPYNSACFDCQTHVPPKTYPVCTIRSTPSLPVHCITWAKEFLFYQLFDEQESSSFTDADAIAKETDNDAEIENLAQEANELAELRAKIKHSDKFFVELVNKIYKVDIERLLSIETLWQTRRPPTPLEWDLEALQRLETAGAFELSDTKVWSVDENLRALYFSSANIQRRLQKEEFISFDKDDDDTMTFVAAASNLRSHVFHIEAKSRFDIKEIAGNIIPAIATTNAFISGFASAIGTRYFQNNASLHILNTSVAPKNAIVSAPIPPPNPHCSSCSARRELLYVSKHDFESLTLQWLVDKLTPLYNEDISIQVGESKLIYDVDFDDYLSVKLSQVPDLKVILVQDDANRLQNLVLYLVIGEETRFPSVDLQAKPVKEDSDDDDKINGDDIELVEGGAADGDSSDVEIVEPVTKKQHIG
ncbi:UBA2 [Candida theae]|uniref:Ubiquitin-activating enzyme E1-like n=1 Tax=Candida theae TaxID=1198502 RepID=A0AAD5BCV8_9ASCO|nr:UBA2 [Candida theae]KAI5955543.1 UBA2 [Candida theae]